MIACCVLMILHSNLGAVKPDTSRLPDMLGNLGPNFWTRVATAWARPNDHSDPPCLATVLQQQCSYTEDGVEQHGACIASAGDT